MKWLRRAGGNDYVKAFGVLRVHKHLCNVLKKSSYVHLIGTVMVETFIWLGKFPFGCQLTLQYLFRQASSTSQSHKRQLIAKCAYNIHCAL